LGTLSQPKQHIQNELILFLAAERLVKRLVFAPIQRDSPAEVDKHSEFSTDNPVQENRIPLPSNI